ncbi:tyrosine-type recombinase/integrase [Terasakiella sp.]|uniref:tyrosine-type recombinase/integrase n=1 Tax=Terasakiella sp. TaxID=2034861 RepID=UPI003AA9979F
MKKKFAKPGIQPHGNGYRFRKTIPKKIREMISRLAALPDWTDAYKQWDGRSTYFVYFKQPHSLQDVYRWHSGADLEAENFFAQVERDDSLSRNEKPMESKTLTKEQAEKLADQIYESKLIQANQQYENDIRLVASKDEEFHREMLQHMRDEAEHDLDEISTPDHPSTRHYVEKETDALIRNQQLTNVSKHSEDYRILKMAVREAMEDAAREAVDLYSSGSKIDIPKPAEKTLAALDRIWEDIEHKYPNAKTRKKKKSLFFLAKEFFDKDHSIDQISYKTCKEYAAFIATMPTNQTKYAYLDNCPLDEKIRRSERLNIPKMSFHTQRDYINAFKAFVKELQKEGVVNIPQDLSDIQPLIAKGDAVEARDPYEIHELKKIFNAPLYLGCISDERQFNTPGPNIIKRNRYWMPLIALWTGMRLNEICQLRVGDIRTSPKGHPFIFVNEEFEDQKLKNKNSQREVPIHPELVKCGFLNFVQHQRNCGEELLFPELPVDKDGYRSNAVSDRYSTFLTGVGIKRKGLTAHSFRHTINYYAELCNVSERTGIAIFGWKNENSKSMSRRYTKRADGNGLRADAFYDEFCKIQYEGLDLSHLHAHADQMRVKI